MVLSVEELRAKCEEWQRILRLQDWIISISVVREYDLFAPDSLAAVRAVPEKRMAKVQILDPIDYPPDSEDQDMELSLVHELLHLHLWVITKDLDGPLQILEEQAIEAISRGLIALYRKNDE